MKLQNRSAARMTKSKNTKALAGIDEIVYY